MMHLYSVRNGGLETLESAKPGEGPGDAMWIDLCEPSDEEEAATEKLLGVDIPTREELQQIEESSRIYEAGGSLFMTGVIIAGISHKRPFRSEVGFVLTPEHLVTIRYADPLPFKTFAQKCSRKPDDHGSSDLLFVSLVEEIVERIADVLEKITGELDNVAGDVFSEEGVAARDRGDKPRIDLQAVVRRLWRASALLGKLRESLLTFNRILSFFRKSEENWLKEEAKARAESQQRDIDSLTEYAQHLTAQIGHLQDGTFNLINIEQNRVIKVFSIAAVLFLPPTLVATVYGMNFKFMPEVNWLLGYPFAIAMMVLSAFLPFYWFKRNGWL
jgi:magnesium transporter